MPTQQAIEKEREIPYNKRDHFHCWTESNPPCGQKIKHFKCCLCEEPHPDIKEANTRIVEATVKSIVEKVKNEKYDEGLEDIGAEAIANHAYDDKFEAFRYGYNQAIDDVLSLLSTDDNQKIV